MKKTLALWSVGCLLLAHSSLAQDGSVGVGAAPHEETVVGDPAAVEPASSATSALPVESPVIALGTALVQSTEEAKPAATAEVPASETPVSEAPAELDVDNDPATHEPVDDENYPLLGEYVGDITTPGTTAMRLGIQVRPLGGDHFEARQYAGGLPGEEGFRGQSQPLVGFRAGDTLVLSGAGYAIFVEREQCRVIDREGSTLGHLARVERTSPTLGAQPPADALVLFDGTNTDHFSPGKMTKDGWLLPGADLKPMFQDFNMHLEFKLPYLPEMSGQSRGNSGCYLLSRYEVQILDSFTEATTFNGCSSLYRLRAPELNMCFPALQWQTYDIAFTAPRWAGDGTKLRHARITVWHNGVKTHDDAEIESKTGAGKPEEPSLLPIRLQDHNDPVRFRNIWIIDRGLSPVAEFPVMSP